MLEKIGSIVSLLLILLMTFGAYFWFDDFAALISSF